LSGCSVAFLLFERSLRGKFCSPRFVGLALLLSSILTSYFCSFCLLFLVQRYRGFQLFIPNFLELFGLSFVLFRGFARAGFAEPPRTPENRATMVFVPVLSI
jgi:hypothetical protein